LILLLAVVVGLLAGWLRARSAGRRLAMPDLSALWLVLMAYAAQWPVFYWEGTRRLVSDAIAAVVLVGSQGLLLLFAWRNRRQPGFVWLGVGLLLNLLVIILNGGLMPISPETVTQLSSAAVSRSYPPGSRLGGTKDRVLLPADIRLPWLADRFVTPAWPLPPAAFSLGDLLIAIGAFWFFWQAGRGVTVQHNK
jgi:hypothetical protein